MDKVRKMILRTFPDGSVKREMYVGVAENGGNLPRGLYVPNGIYTLTISESGYRTVKWKVDGGADNICDHL